LETKNILGCRIEMWHYDYLLQQRCTKDFVRIKICFNTPNTFHNLTSTVVVSKVIPSSAVQNAL
jgi:hypothetical protein